MYSLNPNACAPGVLASGEVQVIRPRVVVPCLGLRVPAVCRREGGPSQSSPEPLRSIAEVARGSGGLAIVEKRFTVGRGPKGVHIWQHGRLQIRNGTTARAGSNRRQALASAVIRHNRDLAQR